VVTVGAGVVGDGLHIRAELVGVATWLSMARGGSAHGGAPRRLERRGFVSGGACRRSMVPTQGSRSCLALPHSLGRRAWGRTAAGGTVIGGEAAWCLGE
jgi:hypothetical protein